MLGLFSQVTPVWEKIWFTVLNSLSETKICDVHLQAIDEASHLIHMEVFRGRSRIFFRRGCTRLLLYFNTNKPHSFFFLQNISCIRKPQVISGARGVCTPCTVPLDLPLHGSIPPGTNSFQLALPMPHRKNDKCYPVSKASLMKPLRLSKVRI